MNLTERTTAALEWIDAQLAICEAENEGPWKSDRGYVIGNKEIIVASNCWPKDATFIAAARTGYPAMLEGMNVAIAGILNIQKASLVAGNNDLSQRMALDSILTTIENLK